MREEASGTRAEPRIPPQRCKGRNRPTKVPESTVEDILARWPSAFAGVCGLCNRSLDSPLATRRLSASEFRAVVQQGYNPFATGRVPARLASAFGFGTAEAYEGWRHLDLADPSDWALCDPCATEVAGFIARHERDAQALSTVR